MATLKVAPRSAAGELAEVLDSPEVARLIADLVETRSTGRPGYPVRAMVGLALAKALYAIPTWTRTVRLVHEHDALRVALGCGDAPPSHWACYRFAAKLRAHQALLDECIGRVTDSLQAKLKGYGDHVAIDASDMPAYANGQRYTSKNGPERERFSDPDASWGHRSAVSTRKGGGFYGYKLQAAVCTKTGLPVAWSVETARANESMFVAPLIDAARQRGFAVDSAAADKAYDIERVYAECAERDCLPIIPVRQTGAVKRGDHLPPECEHGTWTFAGSDYKRQASKWRCPTGECKPASTWIKASRLHPLIPRETKRWKQMYRKRAAVEREFGRLKHDWALLPLRVRGVERVRLHADLAILAKLSCTLERARAATRARVAARAAQRE
ncbi:MAG: transposase [Solirubrobacterales bacterium]|nr:transposase [Solirubrobacterales bacterium]